MFKKWLKFLPNNYKTSDVFIIFYIFIEFKTN
jgi:hypothetical protein